MHACCVYKVYISGSILIFTKTVYANHMCNYYIYAVVIHVHTCMRVHQIATIYNIIIYFRSIGMYTCS